MTVPLRNLDEPVMRHARTDIVAIPARHTVQEVLDDIRIRPAATGSFFYLYVIDDDRRLAGPLRALADVYDEQAQHDLCLGKVLGAECPCAVGLVERAERATGRGAQFVVGHAAIS